MKSGMWKEWENWRIWNCCRQNKYGTWMFSSPIFSFKIIRFCDLQLSCGACNPEPFGSNSGSNLLKLAQALAAKSATDIRFLQIWKLHTDTWKLLFILTDLQVSVPNCIPYQSYRAPHRNLIHHSLPLCWPALGCYRYDTSAGSLRTNVFTAAVCCHHMY